MKQKVSRDNDTAKMVCMEILNSMPDDQAELCFEILWGMSLVGARLAVAYREMCHAKLEVLLECLVNMEHRIALEKSLEGLDCATFGPVKAEYVGWRNHIYTLESYKTAELSEIPNELWVQLEELLGKDEALCFLLLLNHLHIRGALVGRAVDLAGGWPQVISLILGGPPTLVQRALWLKELKSLNSKVDYYPGFADRQTAMEHMLRHKVLPAGLTV